MAVVELRGNQRCFEGFQLAEGFLRVGGTGQGIALGETGEERGQGRGERRVYGREGGNILADVPEDRGHGVHGGEWNGSGEHLVAHNAHRVQV